MPFRMSKTLRFWVEVECEEQDLSLADDREVAAILGAFEQSGDAMRSLNHRGLVGNRPHKCWSGWPTPKKRLTPKRRNKN
jgi:hypothetical protein